MLQFITHPSDSMTIIDEIRSVVAGGCGWVQLRMKDASPEEIIAVAKEAKKICKEADCILIIDDYPDIAKELELDGVHLGKNDMSPTEARELRNISSEPPPTPSTTSKLCDISTSTISGSVPIDSPPPSSGSARCSASTATAE